MGWGNGLQEVKHSRVRLCFWHCIEEHELHGGVLLAVQRTWHIMHSHISYCSFPCRWITGGWGCCVTSFLLDNHRLRPRVHTKHTIEYPRSAATLWCVHGSPNPAFSFWVWNRKPAMYIVLYSPLMFWPTKAQYFIPVDCWCFVQQEVTLASFPGSCPASCRLQYG